MNCGDASAHVEDNEYKMKETRGEEAIAIYIIVGVSQTDPVVCHAVWSESLL